MGAVCRVGIKRRQFYLPTILRMAAWEILYEEGIPGPVAINEAVNLANRFSEPTSGRFVNGVLGTILRRKQAENP